MMQFLTIGTDNCLFSVVHQQYFLGGGLTVLVGLLAENVVTACVSGHFTSLWRLFMFTSREAAKTRQYYQMCGGL